ncbi:MULTISPECIES: alcohol dehydrogenase AdhP [Aeribacillus]|mgnify:FL=1|uniref:Alcohol dehydrogenase n=1 Tax=Geobacillus stearothermophilus TaxID=1422 RepID=ADH2_GEOSE|nr:MULTISPECIES: alcohol dehydrogenase AdhP [Aeribacillus]P42327.1 RecName: Full=Alcohol dehydrogenase; Short=ADH [Geobacillus stearothermophilus]6IQD_A Chain A, Alcohol dehydrogenase [Geobacillus stearothermophilus]6IQD_B Chain B, Alcohol dehydrogenase [Geobacillus stearothermophilus]6IQD_C Chain C, Alcohol dehydrogenase [Geobacillus stearothermophilus]6IQD_D Chain D, Alcohol dehydrogenase [Geobacillus stearothermophilus]6IQD_E Chain E, Alcohol dehydrogenase [Geobacillus stearothermophilus]
MKAAVVNEFKKALEIKEVERPKLEEGEVLVKIEACGVCHTDLHAAHGDWPIKPKLPLIPGHEGVGIVVEVAKGVKSIKVGDRVGIPWLYSACGECEYCLTGQETLCPHQLNGGYSVDGGYAEYCKAPADYVAKIPDNLDPVEVAPILCAGVTTYKALKVSGARPGEWVAIYGIGGLGHIALQYAKAMGLNVVAVDISDEKSKLAKDLGADIAINGLKEDPVKAIHDQVGGVHAAISVAVNKKAFEQAYQSVKRGGTLVVVGLPNADLPIPIFDTVLNGVSVKGSIVGTRKDMQEALDFAARGKVRPIVETAELEEINEVFERMEKGKINGRIVLKLKED